MLADPGTASPSPNETIEPGRHGASRPAPAALLLPQDVPSGTQQG